MRRRTLVRARLVLLLAAMVLVVGVIAGGTAAKTSGPQAAKSQQATTITLAHWSSSAVELSSLRKTLTAFQKAYPSIKVKEINLDPYPEGMLARFAARKPPDLFYVDSSVFPDWQKQGVLEPLNSRIVNAHIALKPFYGRLLAAFRDNKGQIYGFPKDWSPLAMEVNTTALAAAGVRAPGTWSQLTAALQKLKNAGQPPACLSIDLARILAFMYQNGGRFLNATKTAAVVNSTANVGAVGRYIGWLKSGLAKTPQQLGVGWCGEALGKEVASIIFEGNWVYSYMKETFPTVKWAVRPMVRNKTTGNLGFTVSYSIGKDSAHKDQAFKLLTYLTGPKGMGVWTKNVGYLPSRKDVAPPPGRAIFLREAPWSRAWQFAPGFSKVIDTANSELQSAYEGKESVSAALNNIQAAATQALRRGR
ncbi:MAG TPA: extracellular solute-binding protein [Gaiellaceae bacterium]